MATITFEFDLLQGSGPERVVDYYIISISPEPLSHPVINSVYSSPWNVTVSYNTEYTATIKAVNCVGVSSVSRLSNIILYGTYKINYYLANCCGDIKEVINCTLWVIYLCKPYIGD